jgi:hypothetical protein
MKHLARLLAVALLVTLTACAPPPSKVPLPNPDHGPTPSVKVIIRISNIDDAPISRNVIGTISAFGVDGKPAIVKDKDTGVEKPMASEYSRRASDHYIGLDYGPGVSVWVLNLHVQGYGGDQITLEVTDASGTVTVPHTGVEYYKIPGSRDKLGVVTVTTEIPLPL